MADLLRDRLQSSLGTTYTLERELGGGGMSRVFLAEETAFRRRVVIKVLPPELASAVSSDRFRREIMLAAGLQHPHVVPLLSAGAADALLYYTMPFVDGESLRARLSRMGDLPVNETLRLLREVAGALRYAHGRGVVHRDIKPDNILLAGDPHGTRAGHAMITDFGVAKAVRAAVAGDDGGQLASVVTSMGVALGTPAYMAPEQAAADPHADHRVDIYAVGALAYEMLAGRQLFPARSPQAMLAAQVIETPEPLDRLSPSAPPELVALVMRCLAKLPADRPQSADELLDALEAVPAPSGSPAPAAARAPAAPAPLVTGGSPAARPARARRLLLPGALVALLGAGGLFAWRRAQQPVPGADAAVQGGVPSLAVLPFENLGDSSDRYFADGVTDEVRGKLAALPGLRVIGRTSSEQYRGATRSPREIGRELGVEYLLTGTVRWDKPQGGASRVRVSPQLIRVSTAAVAWQEPFDATLTDVFQVQAEIAGRAAQALDVALGTAGVDQFAARPTRSVEAYDAYLRAEQATGWRAVSDPATLREAISLYQRAVALDTGFAAAWARMSEAQSMLYTNTVPTPDLAARAKRAAERAVALAPRNVRGYAALGVYSTYVEEDWPRALAALDRAGQLAPQDVEVLLLRSVAEYATGRADSALSHALRAASLDPRSARAARHAGHRLADLRRFAEADSLLARAQALAPASPAVLQDRVLSRLGQGDLPGARTLLRAAPAELPQLAVAVHMSKYSDLYWVLDSAQQALVLASRPSDFDDDVGSWALSLAEIQALRGDSARARVYADSARLAFEAQVREVPDEGERHALLGVALAYAGRHAEALRAGERAVALRPMATDREIGAYVQLQLARIHLLAGREEQALDLLEPLLRAPWYLTPAWLRIDPTFAPLRDTPRFERLARGGRERPAGSPDASPGA